MLPTATTTTQPQPPSTRDARSSDGSVGHHFDPGQAVAAACRRSIVLAVALRRRRCLRRRTVAANSIDDVRTASGQLLGVQDIRVRIVHADAIASSSYLRSGQEDPAQRTAYLDEIAKAGDGLVAVSAAANDTDLVQLSEASRLLGSYVGLVEQARANNRQGFPVGAHLSAPGQRDRQQQRPRHARHRVVAAGCRGIAARPDQRQPCERAPRRCVAAV